MRKERKNNSFFEVIVATFIALIISIVLVIIAAFAIKLFNVADSAIVIINQVIKSLSILLAILFCFKSPSNGWISGFIVAVLYVLMSFVVFSLLSGEFIFDITLLNDVALCGVSGLLSGIIAVNARKKN